MRTVVLTESKSTLVSLDANAATALAKMGARLASDKEWWGQGDTVPERSVIECSPAAGGGWWVRVANAVGLIAVGDLQLLVKPKIPTAHLLYLFELSGRIPRVEHQAGALEADASLWNLVARWFVAATERVLRRDLSRDYREEEDALSTIRGRIQSIPTARRYYSGHFDAVCTFEEYSFDTPLNRILRAAASAVVSSPLLPHELRRRARMLVERMHDAGPLLLDDLNCQLERRTSYYRDALAWARDVLRTRGRGFGAGSGVAWSFLLRTPEAVEEALRRLIAMEIGTERAPDDRRRRRVFGSTLTFTPDIVIDGGVAVADVKYKVGDSDWRREDLYQITTFATVFKSDCAAVVDFGPLESGLPKAVQLGPVRLESVRWPTDANLSPQEASSLFRARAANWVSDLPAPVGQITDHVVAR